VLATRISAALGRDPTYVAGHERPVIRIAWCTGGAQGFIEQAATLGVDAYLSGEISEQTTHQARELGLHYFAAGHHATERYGVQAFGQHLAEHFGIEHLFLDLDNPA
jgi:putative NIF3 family GTP cyclohydrolase 1 type 2